MYKVGPSAEQRAQIESLRSEIKKYESQVNRPYSVVLSMLLGTGAIYLLFHPRFGLLKDTYAEEWISTHVESCIDYKTAEFQPVMAPLMDRYNNIVKGIESELMVKMHGAKDNLADTLRYWESKINSDEAAKIYFEHKTPLIKAAAGRYLKDLILIWKGFIEKIGGNPNEAFRNINDQVIDQLDPAQLMQNVKATLDGMRQLPQVFCKTKIPVYFEAFRYIYSAVTKTPLTIVADYFATDRLLNYVWPSATAARSANEITSHDEATRYIKNLQTHRNKLTLQAKQNIRNARYLMAILAIIFLMVALITDFEATNLIFKPELVFLGWAILGASLVDAAKDVHDYYQQSQLTYRLKNQQEILQKALESFNYSLQCEKHTTMASSYFALTFNAKTIRGEKVTGSKLARFFKDCCFYYKVPIISRQQESVYIAAGISLNAEKAEKINKLFLQMVQREIKVRKLIKQLETLFRKVGGRPEDMYSSSPYDAEYLPIAKLVLSFSADLDETILKKLEEFFGDNCQIDNSATESVVTITGHEPIADDKFNALLDKIARINKELIDAQQRMESATTSQQRDSSVIINRRIHKAPQSGFFATVPLQQNDNVSNIIRWRALTLDKNADTKSASPVLFGKQQHNDQNYRNARTFITNKLDWNKIPAQYRDDVKKKVNHFLERPKFASRAQGDQGLLDWNKPAWDQDGNEFRAAKKGKILGEGGDIRIFCDEEIASTGETLLGIKGIELKAHKSAVYRK